MVPITLLIQLVCKLNLYIAVLKRISYILKQRKREHSKTTSTTTKSFQTITTLTFVREGRSIRYGNARKYAYDHYKTNKDHGCVLYWVNSIVNNRTEGISAVNAQKEEERG